MPILQCICASIMMHLNSIALSFIYTQHVKVFFTCKFYFYNPMCFNRYANYFPHNSHIIDLLCCKYVCYLSRMAVDVGHNRPIVLQICDVSPLRKHRKTSPIGILLFFHTIQFTLQRCLGNLRDLKTYEFHRCIAECRMRSSIEIIFTGNGGKCAKIRLISW